MNPVKRLNKVRILRLILIFSILVLGSCQKEPKVNPSGGPDTPVKPEPPTPPEPQTSRVIAIVAPGSLDARLKNTATVRALNRDSL